LLILCISIISYRKSRFGEKSLTYFLSTGGSDLSEYVVKSFISMLRGASVMEIINCFIFRRPSQWSCGVKSIKIHTLCSYLENPETKLYIIETIYSRILSSRSEWWTIRLMVLRQLDIHTQNIKIRPSS
jgi:hypothetical protein